jgi:signal transduction histidine kinase
MWRRRIIHLESPTEAVPVVADAERIAQVVGNYLSNALKYSPNVQPVEVRLEYGDGEARVAVCDHGVGIAPECQQRVWERFYRTSGSRSYSADGLGVGLFICRQLVEQMGGTVGLESLLGEGSTFWFTIPLATS